MGLIRRVVLIGSVKFTEMHVCHFTPLEPIPVKEGHKSPAGTGEVSTMGSQPALACRQLQQTGLVAAK